MAWAAIVQARCRLAPELAILPAVVTDPQHFRHDPATVAIVRATVAFDRTKVAFDRATAVFGLARGIPRRWHSARRWRSKPAESTGRRKLGQ